jgi:hypothetical protein
MRQTRFTLPDRVTRRILAEFVGVNVWTITQWVKKAILPPPIKAGPRTFWWKRSVIETHFKSLERAAAAEFKRLAEGTKKGHPRKAVPDA